MGSEEEARQRKKDRTRRRKEALVFSITSRCNQSMSCEWQIHYEEKSLIELCLFCVLKEFVNYKIQ